MTWKPGDRPARTDSMIRVDQAGEFGATRIYAGQLAVMGHRTAVAREIAGMALQEEKHRAFFDRMIAEGDAKSGDLALLIAFGAGLAYAAQVVTVP